MGRKKKIYKKADIFEAIKGSGGIVTTVALALNCDWHTAKANIEKYEETREAFSGELETGLDLVEGKAYQQAKNGDGEAAPQELDNTADNELTIEIMDGGDED